MPDAETIARAAVKACLQDLRERQGFQQLIEQCERTADWPKVKEACVAYTVRAIEPLFPKPKQETIDFA